MRRTIQHLAITSILAGFLAACNTTNGSGEGSMSSAMQGVTDSVAGLFGDTADPEIHPMVLVQSRQSDIDVDEVENVEAMLDVSAPCDAAKTSLRNDFSLGQKELRETEYGIWPVQKATDYANQILDRIVACSPFDPVPASVVIVPKAGRDARVYRDGLIEISVESFDGSPQAVDILAFTIAHEYSHILLKHYERGQATEKRNRIFRTALEAAFLADDVLNNNGADAQAASKLKTPMMVNRTMDVLFEYSWGRQDEHEADMVGLHLATRAGFEGYAGASGFLDKLKDQPTIESRVLALAQDKERIVGDLVKGGVSGGKDGIMDALKGVGGDMAQSLSKSLEESHPSPDARKDMLLDHSEFVDYDDFEMARLDMGLDQQFPLPDYDKITADRELQAALKAFAAAEDVHEALGSVGSLSELSEGTSVDTLLAKAKVGVSGAPWLENNAFGRIAFSSLRQMQGKNDLAIIGFERYALKQDGAPLRVYEGLMDRQIQAKNVKAATETFAAAEAEFGSDNDILYPMRIKLAHAKGEDTGGLLAGCRLAADPRIARMCRFWQQGGIPQS